MNYIGFGAMDATNPYELIGFGAMDATNPYEFIRFGAMDPQGRTYSRELNSASGRFFRPFALCSQPRESRARLLTTGSLGTSTVWGQCRPGFAAPEAPSQRKHH
jgi:hypothetical protein